MTDYHVGLSGAHPYHMSIDVNGWEMAYVRLGASEDYLPTYLDSHYVMDIS